MKRKHYQVTARRAIERISFSWEASEPICTQWERMRVEIAGERGDKWHFHIPEERAGDEEQRLAAGSRREISS